MDLSICDCEYKHFNHDYSILVFLCSVVYLYLTLYGNLSRVFRDPLHSFCCKCGKDALSLSLIYVFLVHLMP